jgi:hypothetical protein
VHEAPAALAQRRLREQRASLDVHASRRGEVGLEGRRRVDDRVNPYELSVACHFPSRAVRRHRSTSSVHRVGETVLSRE